MNRRDFLSLSGAGAAFMPAVALAQTDTSSKPKIGVIYPGPKSFFTQQIGLISSGLRAAEVPPAQVEFVVRTCEGDPAVIPPMVGEVLSTKPALLVAIGPAVLREAVGATHGVPILAYDFESDPIGYHFADSLARPGHNVSGVFLDFPNFTAKWIELLRECMPKLARLALVWDPTSGKVQVDAMTAAANSLGLRTDVVQAQRADDYARAFDAASAKNAEAVAILSSPSVTPHVKLIADLALGHRIPSITMFPDYAKAGGFLSYGPNLYAMYRQIGVMAAHILRGQKVSDVPIERPSKFELTLNQKTAEALGLTPPASVVLRADEVIE